MSREAVWTITAVVGIAIASLVVYLVVQSGAKFVCIPDSPTQKVQYEKTIAAVDSIVDLGIKLSTTLVGLGAALLLGLKSGFAVALPLRMVVLLATICFAQSALYALWWRLGIAELWFNECLNLVVHSRLQYRYLAHFYTFIAGLASIGLLVLISVFTVPKKAQGGDFS